MRVGLEWYSGLRPCLVEGRRGLLVGVKMEQGGDEGENCDFAEACVGVGDAGGAGW